MNKAEKEAIKNLENPYAWLSDFDPVPKGGQQKTDPRACLIWKNKTEFYGFLAECLATGQFGRTPPDAVREVAERVVKMTAGSQAALRDRLNYMKPDGMVVHNRLGPKQVQLLAATIGRMVDETNALNDGQG